MRVSIAVPLFLLSLFAVDVAATPIPGLKQAKIARRDDLSKRDTADSPKPSKVYQARSPGPSKRAPGPSAALGARAPKPSKRAPKPSAAYIARAPELSE